LPAPSTGGAIDSMLPTANGGAPLLLAVTLFRLVMKLLYAFHLEL
jgi:hypothetical protein